MLTLRFGTLLNSTYTVIQAATGDYKVFLAPINLPSDDERVIVGTLGWRSQVPLMFSDSEEGHGDARMVGNVVDIRLETVANFQWAVGRVDWDKGDNELARQAQRLVDEGRFNGTSIHIGKGRFADVCPIEGGGFKEVEFPEDWTPEEVDGELISFDPPCENMLLGMFEAELAAATIVAIPAFPDAGISVEGQEPLDALVAMSASAVPVADGLVVSAWEIPSTVQFNSNVDSFGQPWAKPYGQVMTEILQSATSLDRPPKEWFENPAFGADASEDGRLVWDDKHHQWGCALTVLDDGRVFGHLALWNSCHTGFGGKCIHPERNTDYSYYQTCRVFTQEGERIGVGPLVVDDGHTPPSWATEKVLRYYADTRLAAAYVNVGEDDHGVWVAGAISHKATPSQVETLRRHPLSGEWRKQAGITRLVAAVSVNAPGFMVPEVLVASTGEDIGLITYGPAPKVDEPSDLGLVAMGLERVNERLEQIFDRISTPNLTVNNYEPLVITNPSLGEDLEAEVDVALALDA